MIIAIDGPAGAGKTTVARALARALNLTHIDTGAMYRAVALQCLRLGVAPDDNESIVRIAQDMTISFQPCGQCDAPGDTDNSQRVIVNGFDVTREIRDPAVTALASPISAIPAVRQVLVAKQRELAESGNVVMEGRDIGTVVLPNADLKVFLTASPDVRARRRYEELLRQGHVVDYSTVLRDINERDTRDSTRADSPMVPAADAVLLNTDDLSVEEVVERIARMARATR
jgi:cytidylate kinase